MPDLNCSLHLRQVLIRAAGCNVFGDFAVVVTGTNVGESGADIGWYLLKVENADLVEFREFVGSLCISAQWPLSRFTWQTVLPVARRYSTFRLESKWISLAVALDSATIFVNMVGINATWDSFIFDFLLGVLMVMVAVP